MRVVILIDGGNARVLTRQAGHSYNPDYIEKIARACMGAGEELLRILYYDCAPYNGTVVLPVSGATNQFTASAGWLHELARRDLFAVRLGTLKFRGYRPRTIPLSTATLTDSDFEPVFEQKGVDMRIGLDITVYCDNQSVDRIILLTQDTDCIPAMKHARKAGVQLVLATLPNSVIAAELLEHTDIKRAVSWPA